jgi:hypothetical protein
MFFMLAARRVIRLRPSHFKRILATTNIVMRAAAQMEKIVREATRQWTMHATYKKMSAAVKAMA